MQRNNVDWLQIAEYISLTGAVVGSIAAVAFEKVIYAAVLLFLSIWLNLIHRHRLEQVTQQKLLNIITQLDQTLTGVKKVIDQQVEDLRNQIAQLNQNAANNQPAPDTDSLVKALQKLQQQLNVLEQSLAPVKSQLDGLTQQFNNRPEIQQFAALEEALAELKARLDVGTLQKTSPPAALEPSVEVASLRREIATWQQGIEQQLSTIQLNRFQNTDAPSAQVTGVLPLTGWGYPNQPEVWGTRATVEQSSAGWGNPSEPESYPEPETVPYTVEENQESTIGAEELLRRYQQGERDFTGFNIAQANQGGANFSATTPTQVDLRGANLMGGSLTGANLAGATITQANLSEADLRGASLSGANLTGTNLSGANLDGADLEGANLAGADLTRVNLRTVLFANANLQGANLAGQNLSGFNLSSLNLSGANLRAADLSGANLEAANLTNANLELANLSGANFGEGENMALFAGAIMPDGSQHD